MVTTPSTLIVPRLSIVYIFYWIAIKDRARVSKDRFKPKTFANRAVRRYEEVPGGKSGFKKIYCSWNISDYRFKGHQNEAELKRQWDNGDSWLHSTYKSYQKALFDWRKWYRRK